MSSKPLAPTCSSFITLLWGRYMWQSGAEGARERRWMLLLWKTVCGICSRRRDLHLPQRPPAFSSRPTWGIFCPAMRGRGWERGGGLQETPWQVGRHKDSILLIIDGNKLHPLDVWQGKLRWMWIQMSLWMSRRWGIKGRWETKGLSKRKWVSEEEQEVRWRR